MAYTTLSRKNLIGLLGLLVFAAPALAQPAAAFKLERVEFGFRPYTANEATFKAGLWAPVFVTFAKAGDGGIVLPVEKDGVTRAEITCAVNDAEGTQGVYTSKLELSRADKTTVVTYAQPGIATVEPNLTIVPGGGASKITLPTRTAMGGKSAFSLPMDGNLYLTVGGRLTNFDKALDAMGGTISDLPARVAAFEDDPERLPDKWFGYQSADVVILTTEANPRIVNELFSGQSVPMEERAAALVEWVRRGGHLVLSVSEKKQDKIYQFLYSDQSPWRDPPFPPLLTRNETITLTKLERVHQWVIGAKAMPVNKELTVPLFQPDKTAEIIIEERKGDKLVPMMVRVPYGLGSVTLTAFLLDGAPFNGWESNQLFWQTLVKEIGPKSRAQDNQGGGMKISQDAEADLSTRLHRELDYYNVPMISFSWVALFIFLYILVVGPLDYFLLKKVFKRLEWTWITFPAVVILISVVAYFTAYALKGDQLKINKIDLVDIDMRTNLDKEYKPKKAYALGTTWFSLLSPRIKNYTITVQPKLDVWAGNPAANPQTGEVMVTWMGRPEVNDFTGTGKSRSAGLFRRTYDYAEDAKGLREVPIPVWTTKAFTAAWAAKFDALPVTVDLHYDTKDPSQKWGGTIQSHLPLDLEDAYLFYGNRVYTLKEPLAAGEKGNGKVIKLEQGELLDTDLKGWLGKEGMAPNQGGFDQGQGNGFFPTRLIKQMYFFDKLTLAGTSSRNHSLRPLDQSWRLGVLPLNDDKVHTAILVGRFARAEGDTFKLHADNDPRLPTHLWLGGLPGEKTGGPDLSGTMIQDTYVRIFVPVRPKT